MEKLKVRNLEIEGFGKLKHVVMRELGDRIILEGVNGVGKSTILNSIRVALEGKTAITRPLAEMVTDGYESGVIKLDLADGTEVKFSIRVIVMMGEFDLQIKEVREDGKPKKIAGPMTFLKTIVNAISFSPQQWRKKTDAEQCEEVFGFFPGLKEMLDLNSKELSEAERGRAETLGKCKVLRLDVDRTPFTPGLPEKEVDPAELVKKLNESNVHNKQLENLKSAVERENAKFPAIDEGMKSISDEIDRKLEMIEQLQRQVESSKVELADKRKQRVEVEKEIVVLNGKIESFQLKQIEPIQQEIDGIAKKNESIRQNMERKRLQEELEQTELKGQELYKKIASIKEARTEIMNSAEIPIEGLSIGDGCLLYPNSNLDMTPLSALSDGEFWPVSIGLVAAFKPRVGIVVVDNYWDLDAANFEALCAAAKNHEMQVWIHKTLREESDAGAGFLIRGGEVINGPNG